MPEHTEPDWDALSDGRAVGDDLAEFKRGYYDALEGLSFLGEPDPDTAYDAGYISGTAQRPSQSFTFTDTYRHTYTVEADSIEAARGLAAEVVLDHDDALEYVRTDDGDPYEVNIDAPLGSEGNHRAHEATISARPVVITTVRGDDGDEVRVQADELIEDQGTVVIFAGDTEYGQRVTFGVDHRNARDLARLLEAEGPQWCAVPPWAILGTFVQPELHED